MQPKVKFKQPPLLFRNPDSASSRTRAQTVDIRQFDIEDETGRNIRLVRADILAGRAERDSTHTMRGQKFPERLANPFIVVDDEDDMLFRIHGGAYTPADDAKTNVASRSSFLSDHNRPP